MTAAATPQRLLFVCLGNICRSPAAEAVLQTLIDRLGLNARLQVDSAGTSSYHIGEPADARMRAAAGRRGYEVTSRARMVHRRDFAEFDWLVAMDRNNLRELMKNPAAVAERVVLLSDFLEDTWPRDVLDPYFGGEDGFQTVLDMLEVAAPNIIARLLDAPAT